MGMVRYLARAAREKRMAAGKLQRHVAEAGDFDSARVSAFEKGREPRHLGRMVRAYATCLGIEERELWERALELWAAEAIDSAAQGIAPNDETPD